jgi:hypothetical protein
VAEIGSFERFEVAEGFANEFSFILGEAFGEVVTVENPLMQEWGALAEMMDRRTHNAAALGREFGDVTQGTAEFGFFLGAQLLKRFKVVLETVADAGLNAIKGVETAFERFAPLWGHAIKGALALGGRHAAETLDQDFSGSRLGGQGGGKQDQREEKLHRES